MIGVGGTRMAPPGPLPFVPPGAALVAFGRQALGLVAREFRLRGVRSLLAPDYYCPTMFVPFQLEGIRVHEVATGTDCLMDAAALAGSAEEHPAAAVLHCETFGNLAGPALREVLTDSQARGLPVVVDQTHSLPGAEHFPGDYAVASLRKLLPVPDGAWVTGVAEVPELSRSAQDDAATAALVGALDLEPGWAERRLEAEAGIDELWTPAAISPEAMDALARLDPSRLIEERRANATRLLDALPGVTLLNPDAPECCIAISHPRAESISQELAAHGILTPGQWSRPQGGPRTRPWRTDVLALPVDRRLTNVETRVIQASVA